MSKPVAGGAKLSIRSDLGSPIYLAAERLTFENSIITNNGDGNLSIQIVVSSGAYVAVNTPTYNVTSTDGVVEAFVGTTITLPALPSGSSVTIKQSTNQTVTIVGNIEYGVNTIVMDGTGYVSGSTTGNTAKYYNNGTTWIAVD